MSEIIAGLHVTAVYRLRRTWAVISKEQREEYAECIKLMDTEKNKGYYEGVLKAIPLDQPCLPYFGERSPPIILIRCAWFFKLSFHLVQVTS